MDTLLIAATGLSLAMALGMATIVLKLLREERRRSDARVATLIAMSAADPHVARDPSHPTPDLFAEPARSSPWGARLAVAVALAAIVSGAGYLALSGSRSVPASGSVAGGAAAVAAAPLELLSLRHAEEAGGLAVSGLVQNPRAGAPLTRVIATAIAFGADGGYLASGRAPLDFTTLAPGTESPFVVHIPVTGAVARYRIGFRAEGGDVIAHVDKRGAPDAVARK